MLTDDERNHLLSIADTVASLHAVDADYRRGHCIAAAERIRAIAAPRVATVGELLATAPVGAIVEWQDENDAWMRCVVGQRIASMWWEYPPKWTRPCYGIDLECIRFPARLVPAHLADADPASRGDLPQKGG